MLLVVTSKNDLTADFLIVALIERGLPYFRLNSEDISRANMTFDASDTHLKRGISIGPRHLDLDDVGAVWYRRVLHPRPASNLSAAEQAFVFGEFRHLAMGLILNPGIRWVNPIDKVSIAEHKLYQLQIARQVGLKIPTTIVSRNRKELSQFIGAQGTGAICKPIFHGLFVDGPFRDSVYTRRVESSEIDDASASSCPILLQEEVPRIADVRATFIGEDCFVADIIGKDGIIDWRAPDAAIDYRVAELDDVTKRQCKAMMERLGLLYGAFDFIRKSDGELIFLEINPTGEWAWLEDRLGFPMRDSFIKLFYGCAK